MTPERLAEICALVERAETFPCSFFDSVPPHAVRELLAEVERLRGALKEMVRKAAVHMRERCALRCEDSDNDSAWWFADSIRALPIEEPGNG